MKIGYIYYGNHYLFDTWSKSINAEQHSFVPKWIFDYKRLNKKEKSIYDKILDVLRKKPALLQLASIIKSFFIPKSDIYILENAACLSSLIFKRKGNSKIILFYGDQFFLDYPIFKGIKKRFVDHLLGYVDGIITISKLYQNISKRYMQVPNYVVYPYCDTEKYLKYNADITSRNIAFFGYLVKLKAIDLLIDAFLKLNKKYNNKLYLIGGIVDKMKEIEENKNNPNIIVTGWTDKPQEYLKKCGTYINPARKEAFGINILEAMCMGIPPIVSENCGAAEIVKKISPNLIIKTDRDEIIKRFEWVNSDLKRKKLFSIVCKKEARKYTKEKSVKEFKKAFNSVVGRIKR
jgi:glycosyltransferase involved in cell wall biosynthesis